MSLFSQKGIMVLLICLRVTERSKIVNNDNNQILQNTDENIFQSGRTCSDNVYNISIATWPTADADADGDGDGGAVYGGGDGGVRFETSV